MREERKIWVVWSLGVMWQIVSKNSPILMNHFNRDLMAQRLARRAEDREVPGSSPTQD